MSLAQELEEMGLEQTLVEVSPELERWERCKHWLEQGLEYGPLTMPEVLHEIGSGQAQFWPGQNCALVTQIVPYEGMKVCRVLTAGGDKQELRDMRTGIAALARMKGCTHLEVEGRKGWERELKSDGFEFASVVLRKQL